MPVICNMKWSDLDLSFHCGDCGDIWLAPLQSVQLIFPSLSAQIQRSCYKIIPLIPHHFYLLIRIGVISARVEGVNLPDGDVKSRSHFKSQYHMLP